jgi:hypothetical protein
LIIAHLDNNNFFVWGGDGVTIKEGNRVIEDKDAKQLLGMLSKTMSIEKGATENDTSTLKNISITHCPESDCSPIGFCFSLIFCRIHFSEPFFLVFLLFCTACLFASVDLKLLFFLRIRLFCGFGLMVF